jgi:hypothetical protein
VPGPHRPRLNATRWREKPIHWNTIHLPVHIRSRDGTAVATTARTCPERSKKVGDIDTDQERNG